MSMDDVIRPLFEAGKVEVRRFEEGFAWFDMVAPERLYAAARFVREIEERLGTKIACLEQVALEQASSIWKRLRAWSGRCPTRATTAISSACFRTPTRRGE
jgi:dTDP-glucose pyrophosphorylase